jgi:chromosome partitioning protein
MHVIVIASGKGGVGKSTLTAHLAVAALEKGLNPVLIDTDPQGSLSTWWNGRAAQAPAMAVSNISELPDKIVALGQAGYDIAVIDTPPAITQSIAAVVATADLVIIPSRPSPHDLRAIKHTIDIVNHEGKNFIFVVTQAKPNTRLTVQAMAVLSEFGIVAGTIIHDRVDYAGSMTDGRTVLELDPKGRSAAEIRELWTFVHARIHKSTQARTGAAA